MTFSAQDAERHAKGFVSEAREWTQWAAFLGVSQENWNEPLPVVHFVRFVEFSQEWWNAVRVFGRPAFFHRHWDQRARREIMDGDTVVFAKGEADQPTTQWNFDDSNEPHDPAFQERHDMHGQHVKF